MGRATPHKLWPKANAQLRDILLKDRPDLRFQLPLFTVQGLIDLSRFCRSLHRTTSQKIIFSVGISIEELGQPFIQFRNHFSVIGISV